MDFSDNIKADNTTEEGNWIEKGIEKTLKEHNKDLENMKDILVDNNQLKFDAQVITKNHIVNILKWTKEDEFDNIYKNNQNASWIVFAIQYLLNDLWNNSWIVDWLYWWENSDTFKAVKKFQEEWNENNPNDKIKADGRAWPETIKRILLKNEIKNINNEKENINNKIKNINDEIEQIEYTIYGNKEQKKEKLDEFDNNHYESKKVFWSMLNHDDFDFKWWKIYWTSKKAQKNREAFINSVEKKSKSNNCFCPRTNNEFDTFVEYIGKNNIEDCSSNDDAKEWITNKETLNKINEYFSNKEPKDYIPSLTQNELDKGKNKILELKEFVVWLKEIRQYIEEWDYNKTLTIKYINQDIEQQLLEYIPFSIKSLDLRDRHINDISILQNFNNLINLDLSSTNIINISALENLLNLENFNLESLDLSYTNIDDISVLNNPSNLKSVDLTWCNKITDEQIQNLKDSRPDIIITR